MSLRPAIKMTQARGHVLAAPAATEPVTAAEFKTHVRDSGLSDTEANSFVSQARNLIEEMTGLAFVAQSWRLSLDAWPLGQEQWWDGVRQMARSEIYSGQGDVYPPRYPLQNITSVTVYDEDGNASVITVGDVFDVDTYQKPGRLTLKRGATWPIALRANNAIQIIYVAGFGAAADVPAVLKAAILQVAAYLYSHRGDDCDVGMALRAAGGLLASYAVARI